MAIALDINGTEYQYPEVDDVAWGPDATDWAVAVTTGMLQKAGGLFILLDDVDFGANFGLISSYYTSRSANAASAGALRLANLDAIAWRNFANDGDLALSVAADDTLLFNGASIGAIATVTDTATIDLTLTGTALSADIVALSITNAVVSASAAIAYSKLATLTASRALQSSSGGVIEASSVTSTELGYVSGVTSAIQTQINTISGSLSGYQPLDAELTAIAALVTTGFIVRTGAGTVAARSLAATSGQISILNSDGVANDPTIAIADNPVLPGTGSVTMPIGTTAQRPGSPVEGMARYNDDTNSFEGYINGAWSALGGAGLYNSTFTGTTVTTTNDALQKWAYTGASAQTMTAFTFSSLPDGGRLTLVGRSDTNTLTIPYVLVGVTMNGDMILYDGSVIEFIKDNSLLIEVTRNGI